MKEKSEARIRTGLLSVRLQFAATRAPTRSLLRGRRQAANGPTLLSAPLARKESNMRIHATIIAAALLSACSSNPSTPRTGAAYLSWTHAGASSYRVYHGRTPGNLVKEGEVNGDTRTFAFTKLPVGSHYFYVTAVANGTEGQRSNVGSKWIR